MSNSFQNEVESPEMETIGEIAENLVYRLPGCGDIMIRKTLQEVYRDFCRRSYCLRASRQFILHSTDSVIYPVPMFGGYVDSVSEITVDGRKLRFGKDFFVSSMNDVSLMPYILPNEDTKDDILPKCVITHIEIPKNGCEKAPRWFMDKHGDAIASGTMARLMSMTNKPWSDPNQAVAEKVNYENAVNEARVAYYTNGKGIMDSVVCREEFL